MAEGLAAWECYGVLHRDTTAGAQAPGALATAPVYEQQLAERPRGHTDLNMRYIFLSKGSRHGNEADWTISETHNLSDFDGLTSLQAMDPP